MLKIYLRAIKDGRRTVEQIPTRWRMAVIKAIDNEATEAVAKNAEDESA